MIAKTLDSDNGRITTDGNTYFHRSWAVVLYDADEIAFANAAHTNDQWYEWKIQAADDFTRSTKTRYPYASDWQSPTQYFHVEPISDAPVYKLVTFKVVNGTWADGSAADITVSIPLVDADGYPDANGTGRLDVPAGMIPNEGYDPIGHWDITPPTAVQGTDAAVYTYIFVEKPPVTILPETGDSNRLGLWMLTLALSAVGVALVANRTPARKRNG